MTEVAASSDVTIWDDTREALVSDWLYESLNPAERRGLTLLLDVLVNTPTVFYVGNGSMYAHYGDDIRIEFDVQRTIIRHQEDRCNRLVCTVIHEPSGTSRDPCVVPVSDPDVPATDHLVVAAMWAVNGFPDMPHTVTKAIEYVRDPKAYRVRIRQERRLEADRLDAMLREADAREFIRARLGRLGWRELMDELEEARGSDEPLTEFISSLCEALLDPAGETEEQ